MDEGWDRYGGGGARERIKVMLQDDYTSIIEIAGAQSYKEFDLLTGLFWPNRFDITVTIETILAVVAESAGQPIKCIIIQLGVRDS